MNFNPLIIVSLNEESISFSDPSEQASVVLNEPFTTSPSLLNTADFKYVPPASIVKYALHPILDKSIFKHCFVYTYRLIPQILYSVSPNICRYYYYVEIILIIA